jgi:hypothetical protein
MSAKIDVLSFEAGWIDDLVEARTTALNHGKGCRRIENLLPLSQGPAVARPPSRYIAATKVSGVARLLRVVYSDRYAYLVEFGHLYCRFYTNAGQITSGAAAYEITSPYPAAELPDLQVYNDAGTLYLAHPNHPPYRLVYAAATSWTLAALGETGGPFADENTAAAHLLTPSGTTGSITLTATGTGCAPFVTGAAGHVGAKWRIGHRIGETALVQTFTAPATSSTISVSLGAAWKITTDGTWNATLVLEKTYDGSTYETVAQYAPAEGNNYQDPGEETWANATYRLRVSAWNSGTECKVTFTVDPHVHYGYVRLTAVTSTTLATATVVDPLGDTGATSIWAEGSWSLVRGYPRGVGLVDNRLTFVATVADPTTVWQSYSNQYTRFDGGATDAHALTWTFTTGKGDPFLWVLGQTARFVIGTPAETLILAAADPTAALSASNKPEIKYRIAFGNAAQVPVSAFGYTVVLDDSTRRPMRITYNWEQDLMRLPPLNFSQPSITWPGLKKVVFQRGPVPVLWCLRTDGVLLAAVVEQQDQGDSIGWSKCWTAGTDAAIEDIECLPSADGDVLWWVAARTIGGAIKRYVEQLDTLDLQPVRATAQRLDSYLEFAGIDWTDLEALAVNPATGRITVTATGHSFTSGMNIQFQAVEGMAWLNARVLTVADVTANTVTLKSLQGSYLDGRLLPAYTAGGQLRQVENAFAGLAHLEGQAVYAVADGAVLGPYTVTAGAVTLPGYYQNVWIGLHVDWWLQPLRLVLPLPDGSSRGRQQNVVGLWLSVYRSWSCQVGPRADRLREVSFWTAARAEDAGTPELVTGDFLVTLDGALTADPTVLLRGHLPLPACVRALMLDTGMGGSRSFKS